MLLQTTLSFKTTGVFIKKIVILEVTAERACVRVDVFTTTVRARVARAAAFAL